MGRSASPWVFVPLALRALDVAPHDDEMRFLLACAYGRMGLRTCALEELDRLSDQWRAIAPVVQVRQQVQLLPDDCVPRASLGQACRKHAASWERSLCAGALLDATQLHDAIEAWSKSLQDWQVFRVLSGEIVARRLDAWVCWQDGAPVCAAIRRSLGDGQSLVGIGVIVDGMHMPAALAELARHAGSIPEGITTRWTILCENIHELLWGLATVDVQKHFEGQIVEWLVGPDAPRRLDALLATRLGAALPKCVALPDPPRWTQQATPRWAEHTLAEVIGRAVLAQRTLAEAAPREMAALYASRTTAWYADRFAAHVSGAKREPLRVLLFTSRFSTFVRHSAHDLAEGLRQQGCDVRVHMEPDDGTRLVAMSYSRAIVEHRPDLLLTINSPRGHLGPFVPEQLPVVTWVQDSLPYLFDKKLAEAQRPLDLLTGHALAPMFTEHGYDLDAFMLAPMAVSDRKFHEGPVSTEQAQRLACDVAFISHHSATPEQLRDALLRKASATPGNAMTAIIHAAYPELMRVAQRTSDEGCIATEVPRICDAAIESVAGKDAVGALSSKVLYGVGMPLVDRAVRHRVLGWACELAHEHSWKLHIYGRGWRDVPQFAPWAKPELQHDDDLRAAYQCAGVTLHATLHGILHQRLLECALSGGLPLVYLKQDDILLLEQCTSMRATADGVLPTVDEQGAWCDQASERCDRFLPADHPELMMLACQRARLGLPARPTAWLRYWMDMPHVLRQAFTPTREASWFMGDLAETGFTSKAQLASAVARAKKRAAWRENCSAGLRARATQEFTYRRFAQRLLATCALRAARLSA